MALNPTFVDAWVRKGVTLHDVGDYYEADVCFNQAVKLSPLYFKTLYNRGKNRIALKDYDLAITDLLKASDLNARHVGTHLLLADAYSHLEQHELAEKHRYIADELRGVSEE